MKDLEEAERADPNAMPDCPQRKADVNIRCDGTKVPDPSHPQVTRKKERERGTKRQEKEAHNKKKQKDTDRLEQNTDTHTHEQTQHKELHTVTPEKEDKS
jgi:hypothetical protein